MTILGMVVSNFTKKNFGLLFQIFSFGTQESFCKDSDQLDTRLNYYGIIRRHTSSITCVNNYTCIFTRHQPRLSFNKALLVYNDFMLQLYCYQTLYIESKYRKFPSAYSLNSLFNVSGPLLNPII